MTQQSSDNKGSSKVQADREVLLEAKKNGKTLRAFIKLSGPGWLQAAITLGGGSLGGALFLGVLGGTSMLWIQLFAIIMGVIMLSAISYVTLSTGKSPFKSMNQEINPALGWGWLIAAIAANVIWCMPQFALSFEALDRNFLGMFDYQFQKTPQAKNLVSLAMFLVASAVVLLNMKQGRAAKLFDIILKVMVGTVVICFFGVVILLFTKGGIDPGTLFAGFIPDLTQWNQPAGEIREVIAGMADQEVGAYWTDAIVTAQRNVMIAAAATAVGINMTFLLPFSMLVRGWDKPFRGLARFDLATGMAIPYILVTSCVVIATSATLHNQLDEYLQSTDIEQMQKSEYFAAIKPILQKRVVSLDKTEQFEGLSPEEVDAAALPLIAALDENEKRAAMSLVKPNAFQLSKTLVPLLGEGPANLVFGIGVLGMGFSTIVILMLINGYAIREMVGGGDSPVPFVIGCLLAGLMGSQWWVFWGGDTKFWFVIVASVLGSMLLPVAYGSFFLMMNSKRILGDEKPKGFRMVVWNVLMLFALVGATVAAGSAIYTKMMDKQHPIVFQIIVGVLVVYSVLIIAGFFWNASRRKRMLES